MLLSHEEENGDLHCVRVCQNAQAIRNLLFADDSVILMKAHNQNVECSKSLLESYCEDSQRVSIEISGVFIFSPNTEVVLRGRFLEP